MPVTLHDGQLSVTNEFLRSDRLVGAHHGLPSCDRAPIDGLFLDAWRDWGGANLIGLSLTEALTESDHIVQYFEFARFEYWPECDHEGRLVHVGDIGAELLQTQLDAVKSSDQKARSPLIDATKPVDPTSIDSLTTDRRFIDATKHTVRLEFHDIWESTGETSFLGNPLTEEYRFSDRV